jgi:hypothetical protein
MDDQTTGGAAGPELSPEPARAEPIAGEFASETLLDYDGGRQVTVYVPPSPPEAVVFAGDGQLISQWGVFLEAADVPSTMIIGVHGLAEETPRLHEYSPAFDAERFAAHEKFFVEDVRRWARSRLGVALPSERTARCSAIRPVGSSRSPLDYGIRTSTVRSSPARRAEVTNPLA